MVCEFFSLWTMPQRICYSHWANEARNGQLKKRELLLSLSSLITKPSKLDLSNLHYKPHYGTQGCVIRENKIRASITNPIKNTLVPLWTNFNANGSARFKSVPLANGEKFW